MDLKVVFLAILATLLSKLRQTLAVEVDLTIDVDPQRRECFYQQINSGVTYEVEYQVIDGGDMDINFVIQSPSGRVLITDIRKTDNIHQGKTEEAGDFSFCLDNTFSQFSNKVVFFEVVTDEEDDSIEGDDLFKQMDQNMYEVKLEDFKDSFGKIKEDLEKSYSYQKSMRAIESRSRSVNEHNFERINFWGALVSFVMAGVALVNVLMIRGLFEEKKNTHKLMKVST